MSKPAAIFRQGQAQPRTHSFFTSTPYGGQQNAPFGGGVGQPATTGYGDQMQPQGQQAPQVKPAAPGQAQPQQSPYANSTPYAAYAPTNTGRPTVQKIAAQPGSQPPPGHVLVQGSRTEGNYYASPSELQQERDWLMGGGIQREQQQRLADAQRQADAARQQNAPFGGGVGQPATTGYGGQQNAWTAAPSGGFSPGNYANMSPAARPAPFQQTMQTPWGQMDPNQYYQQQQSFVQAAVNQHGQAARNAGTYGAANMPAGAPPSYDPAQLWNTASQMPTSGGMWGNPPTAERTLAPAVAPRRLPWSGWPDGMQSQPPGSQWEPPWIGIPEMQNQPPPPRPVPAQQRSPGVQTNGVGRMRAGSPKPAASARTDDSYQRDWIAMQAQQYRAIGVRNPLAEARRAWNEAPAAADGRRVMVNPNNPWSSKFPDIDPWRALDRRR